MIETPLVVLLTTEQDRKVSDISIYLGEKKLNCTELPTSCDSIDIRGTLTCKTMLFDRTRVKLLVTHSFT